jgi:glucose-6-phosphate dehydrogenase assembly protein OpcA
MESAVISRAQPEKILKDLAKLWVDLGKQSDQGVLRACSMTLIVVIEETQDASAIGEAIAGLMHEHPSRAIVVRIRECPEPCLEARVFAQCWMPVGRHEQICCEQVEITAARRSLADVPAVILGIVAPDLPVVLYCPDVGLCLSPEFQTLPPLAGKVVIDSGSSGDLAGVRYLQSLPKNAYRRADLEWGRLTGWREAVAQIFEDSSRRKAAQSLKKVRIVHTQGATSPAVHYLSGWFRSVLGEKMQIELLREDGPSSASIRRLELDAPGFYATIEMKDASSAELQVDGVSQRAVFPQWTEQDLLRQELSITGRDATFEEVLDR